MSDVKTKAALLLGAKPGASLEEWLSAAITEIEDLRSRLHRYDVPATIEARLKWEKGEISLEEAARSLGISTKALKTRWGSLNLTKKRGAVAAQVALLITTDKYLSDKQMAEKISAGGLVCSAEAVSCARRKMKLPNAKKRRLHAEKEEVEKYLVDYPWMSAGVIRAAMKADGWPWPLPVSRVAELVWVHRGGRVPLTNT